LPKVPDQKYDQASGEVFTMPAFDDGLAETELPHGTVPTDALIVGSGPAGGSAALCLSAR
jgi:hypothetical protein